MHQDIWISVLFHASHMPKVGQMFDNNFGKCGDFQILSPGDS